MDKNEIKGQSFNGYITYLAINIKLQGASEWLDLLDYHTNSRFKAY